MAHIMGRIVRGMLRVTFLMSGVLLFMLVCYLFSTGFLDFERTLTVLWIPIVLFLFYLIGDEK